MEGEKSREVSYEEVICKMLTKINNMKEEKSDEIISDIGKELMKIGKVHDLEDAITYYIEAINLRRETITNINKQIIKEIFGCQLLTKEKWDMFLASVNLYEDSVFKIYQTFYTCKLLDDDINNQIVLDEYNPEFIENNYECLER